MSKFSNNLLLMTREMVVDAFNDVTPVAMSDEGRAKRLANISLIRRNGPGNAEFEIVNIAVVSSQRCEAEFLSLLPLNQKSLNNADLRVQCKGSKPLADLCRQASVVERSIRPSDLDAPLASSLLDTELVRLLERGDPS
tara:strand:- start:8897 stop:9313 length:417 start_codon:yes stop_codon:yes gene_type:complete